MHRDLQYILTTIPGLAFTAVCPWIGWEYRQRVFYQPCTPPQGPCFLTGQGRYSTSDLLHWFALVLQQCKQKLFAWSSQSQHLSGLQFSRKREKSWSSHNEHSERWTGTWIQICLYPLSTNPFFFFFFKSKHTIALCFYMTCHLRSYSFLKMQGKVSAHTPRLQKWLFYSKVINRKKSKHVDSTAQFTPTPSLPGTWKKRAHKQPQQPVFTDLSQVSYTKQKTQELIPSKKPSQSQGWTSHRSAVMLCNLPPTPWAPRPGPISPRMLPCWLTDCTFAQRKAQFSWALDWSFSSRDTIPRCRLAPRPFLLVMPHVCIIADICSGGRAIGPLLQWHAGSMLQTPQTVQRRENSDSTTAKRFPRGKKIILYFYRYCIDMLYWHVMRNSLQKRTGMGQKLC